MSEAYPLAVSQGGTITRYLSNAGAHLPPSRQRISYNPRQGRRIINVPIVAQQMNWHPYHNRVYTQRKKRKTSRHHPYDIGIPRMVPSSRMGLIKWVGAEGTYQPAGQHGYLTFYINSFYNPGAAVDASRPQWYSELAAIYQRYKVVSAKCSIRLINTTTDLVDAGSCFTMSDELPPATAAGLTECIQKGSQFYIGATDENYSNHAQHEKTWSLKKYVRNITTRTGDEYSAGAASNPTKLWCWNINFGSAANLVLKYRCTIEMVVLFFNLQQNAPD